MSAISIAKGPPEKENSASGETSGVDEQNNVITTTANQLCTSNRNPQLCADGLPPIISAEEFRAMHIEPPNGPLDPCDKCSGEMAEPVEIEHVRAEHPDWQPGPVCHCYDDEDGTGVQVYLAAVREVWAKNPLPEDPFLREVNDFAKRLTPEQRKAYKFQWIAKGSELEIETGGSMTVDQMLDFDRDKDDAAIIGDGRWLCKGAQAVIQGPTGCGKSSLIMQWAISLALGKSLLDEPGLEPAHPMRVLIVQAENDLGDMSEEFQDITDSIGIRDADMEQIRDRLTVVRNNTSAGQAFCEFLENQILEHQPDVVFVDPLLAYAGGDVIKQDYMSKFLRTMIGPVIDRTQVLLIWAHHTGKPGGLANGHERTEEQNKYAGLGSSEIQNTCREVINLADEGGGSFVLQFSKRGRRLKMKTLDGIPSNVLRIEQSSDGIVWKRAEGDKVHATKKQSRFISQKSNVRMWVVGKGQVVRTEAVEWGKMNGIGENLMIKILDLLVADKGDINRIYKYNRTARTGPDGKTIKGAQPFIWTTTAKPEE
jgi:AAA domain